MAKWVRICGVADAPKTGQLMQAKADEVTLCLANVNGQFAALNDLCPHAGGSLSAGWVQGDAVVCPLHDLPFDVKTGEAQKLMQARVEVYPVKVKGNDVLVKIQSQDEGGLSGWVSRITRKLQS